MPGPDGTRARPSVTAARQLVMIVVTDDGHPPADDVIAERHGYCGQCGAVFPAGGIILGSLDNVERFLLPFFDHHHCKGGDSAQAR